MARESHRRISRYEYALKPRRTRKPFIPYPSDDSQDEDYVPDEECEHEYAQELEEERRYRRRCRFEAMQDIVYMAARGYSTLRIQEKYSWYDHYQLKKFKRKLRSNEGKRSASDARQRDASRLSSRRSRSLDDSGLGDEELTEEE